MKALKARVENVLPNGTQLELAVASEDASHPDSLRSELRELVLDRFFCVVDVQAVAFQLGEGVLSVRTFLDRWNDDSAEQLYDLELQLMDRFEGEKLDFHVEPLDGDPVESRVGLRSAYLVRRGDARQR